MERAAWSFSSSRNAHDRSGSPGTRARVSALGVGRARELRADGVISHLAEMVSATVICALAISL